MKALVLLLLCAGQPGAQAAAAGLPPAADRARQLSERGRALAAQGREAEAAREYAQALALEPHEPEALRNLAWIRATSADAALRNPMEAVVLARRLVVMIHYKQRVSTAGRTWPKAYKVECSHVMAAAYAAAGQFDEAVDYAQQALETATRLHQVASGPETERLVAESRWILQLYGSRQPYRPRPLPGGTSSLERIQGGCA